MVEQFVGTWKMISSENFDELMKKFGLGAAERQLANQNRPSFTLSVDDQGMICMNSLNIFNAPELKFKLNESVVQMTANNRQTTVSEIEDGYIWRISVCVLCALKYHVVHFSLPPRLC
ncbi:hypothetical protein ILYODFUR_034989 [Ilyodon furcidens]|uniref:Lipocalin/cytosolic fatty-acid binding domain-containing protein n=1 Tax=Ilyodon furcidens TaxID=33524 RepID=A0ABV0T458_9TELE